MLFRSRQIRNLSDELCREHGLSVIIPSGQKGKTHYEWQMAKAGTSWKAQMKSDMDNAIREAHSYEDFISRMQTKGYEVKGETFGDNALKYLSFCASGQSRFTRISERNFGVGYTKESIRERIEKYVKAQEKFPVKKKFPFPKRPDANRTLIDTDKEKFQENGALKHWADIQNLKIAAASYAEGGSVEELKQKISEKNAAAKAARSAVVDLEHEMKAKAENLKYAKPGLLTETGSLRKRSFSSARRSGEMDSPLFSMVISICRPRLCTAMRIYSGETAPRYLKLFSTKGSSRKRMTGSSISSGGMSKAISKGIFRIF